MLPRTLVARRLALWVVPVAVAAIAGAGCQSPTLPLPPPLAPSVVVGPDADHVLLTATCNAPESNSIIVIVNEGTTVPLDRAVGGALTNSCGGWDSLMYGHTGDRLDITYQINGDVSLPTTLYLP